MEPAVSTAAAEDEHTAQLWRDLVDNSVECELCNEPYAEDEYGEHLPRLLGCGHTFCQVRWRRSHSSRRGCVRSFVHA
jgi:hypothetical protein